MESKKVSRLRRALQTRRRIAQLGEVRLSVFRSNQHIYASIISNDGAKVLASASTVEAEVRGLLTAAGKGGNTGAAAIVGKQIAERGLAVGVTKVAFDRSGFAFHGRVKALADAAREAGLNF
jgi:large subunit ribosomal protein L18